MSPKKIARKPAAKPVAQMNPIKAALNANSTLLNSLSAGLGAIETAHKSMIDNSIKGDFTESIDIDEALKPDYPSEHRWDYLLGLAQKPLIVAVERHSATNGEVSVLINKRKAALVQMNPHLRPGKNIAKWIWVASGTTGFSPIDKAILRLAQNGITFAGSSLKSKHLP